MSVDAERVVNLCLSFHELWSLPCQILLALWLLYTQVPWQPSLPSDGPGLGLGLGPAGAGVVAPVGAPVGAGVDAPVGAPVVRAAEPACQVLPGPPPGPLAARHTAAR